jgi:rod shape-determining protein MreC
MLRLARLFHSFFALGHGLVLLVVLMALCLFMRKASDTTQAKIVSTALSSAYYPAQLVLSYVNEFRSVTKENERLKKENARLQLENSNAKEAMLELARLHQLVHFDNKWEYPIVTARVVGHNPGRFLTTFIVNRGTEQGIQTDMPVFTVYGLVGRISKVSRNHSRVQLLLDPNLKISVIERQSRVVGFLEGANGYRISAMIPSHAGVKKGDTLVTSGLGGIFPKGIGIGTVCSVDKGDVQVISEMEITPFQDFSRLEEVFIMQKEPDWVVRELLTDD